jgi:hypothetical protein
MAGGADRRWLSPFARITNGSSPQSGIPNGISAVVSSRRCTPDCEMPGPTNVLFLPEIMEITEYEF